MTKPVIGIIGTGRVGSALALALADAGYSVVAVANRTFATADALAARLPGCVAGSAQEVADAADFVIIATSDDAIQPLTESVIWRDGQTVVHCSGSRTRDLLASAECEGAATGSAHPFQTFGSPDVSSRALGGTVFAVEADEPAHSRIYELVRDLGAVPIDVRSEDKALYHASAGFVGSYVVTLVSVALDMWQSMGMSREHAMSAFIPALKGMISNLETVGVPAALTGPIGRGDIGTVRNNLEGVRNGAPAHLALFQAIARETIPVALAQGKLTDEGARQLHEILDGAGAAEGVTAS